MAALNRLYLFTLMFVSFLLFSFQSFAQDQACTDTLTVSAPSDWPPYSMKTQSGYVGLDIEIVKMVLTEANLCWNFISYPSSPRVMAELERESLDLAFAASITPERESIAAFSRSYRPEFMSLFTHKNNTKLFSLYSTSTVVINRGAYYGSNFEIFRRRCPECVVEVSSGAQRVSLLRTERVDFALLDELTGKEVIKQNELSEQIIATNYVINKNDVHYMVRKSLNSEYLDAINQAIVKSEDKINALVKKYRGN